MQPSPESTKHIPQTRDTPSPPPPGRNPLFSPPPSWPSHSIKIFDTAVSPGSKLTTKQRLARATVAPALPRESPVKNAVPPQPAAASDDAMDIDVSPTLVPNDTANTADGDVTHEISPMLALMHTEDDLPHGAGGTGLYRSDEDPYASLPKNGDSIDSMDVDMDFGGGDGAEPFDAGDGPYMNAEAFLNTVQIPAPSKPPNPDYRPTQPVRPPAPVPQWSWNGKLTITVRDAVQTVCEHVTLTDATAPTVPNKPRINSFVKLTSKELNFPVFYGAHDLQMVLPACQPVQQFARLTAAGPDADSFELLARYMAREGQVVVLPAVWDDDEVIGYLMVFAPTALAGVLDVPPNLSTPDCLIVALVYKTEKVPPLRRHHKRFPYLAPALPSRDQWLKSLRDDKMYHISLRIVKLPPLIQEFAYKHASVVWFERAPGDEQDKDTEHLLRVLKKSKAGVVSPRDPAAELVFVHVAALKNVHNLPLLAQRRLRPDVWFCSYGTCATEPLSRWGTREIYQLGGVVTFTPEALVRDAWGVLKTIRNIHAHPLWICYLLPQVIGMALRLYEEDESMQDYRGSLPLALDRIFDAIVDGKVALVCAPPVNGSKEEWTLAHGIFAPRTKNVMLEHCLKSFEDAYASSMQSDWGTLAHNDLLEDMRRMQVQPAISDLYRRFVVLDAGPDILMHDGEDGIEWFAIGNFDFNDDYMKSASEQPSS
ncbi:hypothetical protein B0H17DRAFT_712999 [Mycena rosella]|uniref:Uncharacterized protein n=1 Tax=Mycena rosella TaxID=1033263 RepID=A0AAD7D9P4_MYCRO|nr:hypothetical protein B0H17DRAFT_712999 [Mycena rosella]